MDKATMGIIVGLAGVGLTLLGILAAWIWQSRRPERTARAETGGLAAAGDQHIAGSLATSTAVVVDRPVGGPTIIAQPGSTVIYVDGLPQARPEVRGHFQEGRRLQEAEEHEAAIREFENAFAAAKDDSQRCALHTLIGSGLLDLSRLPEAEGHYRQALEIAERSGDREGQAAAVGNLGLVYAARGELDKAEEHYKKALAMHERIGNRVGQAANLGNLGIVYRERRELDKAEAHHMRALAMAEEMGDKRGQVAQLGNLGSAYSQRRDFERAEEAYEKQLAIADETGNRLGKSNALGNLGVVHAQRGDLDRAVEHFKKSLAIDEEIGNRGGQAAVLCNLGGVHLLRGELDEAEERFSTALRIDEEVGDNRGQASDIRNLGLVRIGRRHPTQASRHFQRAREIFAEVGAVEDAKTTELLIQNAERLADWLARVAPDQPAPKPSPGKRSAKKS